MMLYILLLRRPGCVNMRINNWQRLKIVLSLKVPIDYSEFKCKCLENGCTPQVELIFAQQVGVLLVACNKYPEFAPIEAYTKFVEETQRELLETPLAVKQKLPVLAPTTPCGSCGGGKVL